MFGNRNNFLILHQSFIRKRLIHFYYLHHNVIIGSLSFCLDIFIIFLNRPRGHILDFSTPSEGNQDHNNLIL